IVQFAIQSIKFFIDGVSCAIWLENSTLQTRHGLLSLDEAIVTSGAFACDHCARNGRAQCAGLVGTGDFDWPASHVGVGLHYEWIFFGDTAAVDDLLDLKTVFFQPCDDGQRAERSCLYESTI